MGSNKEEKKDNISEDDKMLMSLKIRYYDALRDLEYCQRLLDKINEEIRKVENKIRSKNDPKK